MPKTISTRKGNPANAINNKYQELMTIDDLDTLRSKAHELAILHQGRGFSTTNAAKFRRIVSESPTLDRLRFYLTNFLLAADGLAVAN